MNNTQYPNLRLIARNEGKIKSYESCSDVRAWSHDLNARNCYLREWMKCDMPICVLPVSTLTGFLRTMACKSRRRVAPRCHPDCKSKVLLDSICQSCQSMRECFKKDHNFEKFFVEEDLETSSWPCERCLEALKSIKMFWKIIIDKIFNFTFSKYDSYETNCSSGDGVRSIAKTWQTEMVQQAMYVKNFSKTPLHKNCSNETRRDTKVEISQRTIKSWPTEDRNYSRHVVRKESLTLKTVEKSNDRRCQKVLKKVKKEINTAEFACETCFPDKGEEEIKAHKKNLQVLQDKCNGFMEELDKMKRENNSLRIELENVYKSCPWRTSFYCPDRHDQSLVPKPFEAAQEESCPGSAKNIDSEMVITMKKCKNENFRHVSLLQVLHKTNEPRNEDLESGPCCNKEDPIALLTKVHDTFGAIVKREISLAHDRCHRPKMPASDIEASSHRINASKSAPSCSTLSSILSSESNFVNAKDSCY